MKRRLLSFALAAAMCISMVPASVLASSPEDVNTDTTETKTESTNEKADSDLNGADAGNEKEGVPVLLTNTAPQTAAKTKIDSININFVPPVGDNKKETADISVAEGANYTIDNFSWDGSYTNSETFMSEIPYTLCARFKADNGYYIPGVDDDTASMDDIKFIVNGTEIDKTNKVDSDTLEVGQYSLKVAKFSNQKYLQISYCIKSQKAESQPLIPAVTKAKVTFKVVNGKWADPTTADKVVDVTLTDGKGTLPSDSVPTGMVANEGYEKGAWDVAPNTTADAITEDVTYTYTFAKKAPEAAGLAIDEKNFPDAAFRAVVTGFDADKNGTLSDAEIKAVTTIDCSSKNITSLTGIERFTALKTLNCSWNANLKTLDLSKNASLAKVECRGLGISSLDLSSNTNLEILDCFNNPNLTTLNIANCAKLKELTCKATKLAELDLTNNKKLVKLACGNNSNLKKLIVKENTALEKVYCEETGITSLDFGNNEKLKTLYCHDAPSLTEIKMGSTHNVEFVADFDKSNIEITVPNDGANIANWKLMVNNAHKALKPENLAGGINTNNVLTFDNSNEMTFDVNNHKTTLKKLVPDDIITKANVTFKVSSGTWEDGNTADKVVEVTLTNGKGKLTNEQIPTGMKPDEGYEGGSWFLEHPEGGGIMVLPYEKEITGDCAFVYYFQTKNILEATPDSLVGGGEVILKTNKQFVKCDDESIVIEQVDYENGFLYKKVVLPDVTKDYIFTASNNCDFSQENLTVTVHVTKSTAPRPRPDHNNDDDDDNNNNNNNNKRPTIVRPSVVITPLMNPPTGSSL